METGDIDTLGLGTFTTACARANHRQARMSLVSPNHTGCLHHGATAEDVDAGAFDGRKQATPQGARSVTTQNALSGVLPAREGRSDLYSLGYRSGRYAGFLREITPLATARNSFDEYREGAAQATATDRRVDLPQPQLRACNHGRSSAIAGTRGIALSCRSTHRR
ncbi:hypothetical protein FHR49_004160 [Xanthomonas campestris]